MGRLLTRALAQAGLTDVAERALCGRGLDDVDLDRLRRADTLLLAGLADAVRAKFRGDRVLVLAPASADAPVGMRLLELSSGAGGATGEELLREVALCRLATPADRAIGLSFEPLGLELSQTALAFGADVLVGDLGSKRTLPLLDGPDARRRELAGLIARAGRQAAWGESAEEVAAPQAAARVSDVAARGSEQPAHSRTAS